jgi:hypothetical protein
VYPPAIVRDFDDKFSHSWLSLENSATYGPV